MNFSVQSVKDLALDIWDDLRRTGLAGVAVGMALTFIAVSAIVLKPGGPPEINTGFAAANAAPPTEVAVALPGEKPLRISDIDLTAPRDPFRSLDELDAQASGGDALSEVATDVEDIKTASSAETGSGSESEGTSTTAYDDSEELVPLDDLETAKSDPAADSEPTNRSSDPKGEITPQKEEAAAAPVTDYSYAADLQFGPEGSLKRYRSVQRLGLVPSRSLPLLMYLGVATDHKTGVFMVDSSLSQGGEGNCVPKASQCTFLELQTGPAHDEHHFRDAEGQEYIVRLRGLVRTTASAGSVADPDALSETPSVVDGSR